MRKNLTIRLNGGAIHIDKMKKEGDIISLYTKDVYIGYVFKHSLVKDYSFISEGVFTGERFIGYKVVMNPINY